MQIPTLQELLEAGVHFGHRVSRGNPKMQPFIYGAREGVHIIDLTLTSKYLKQALEFVHTLGQTGGVLLFVGTKKQARPIVEELAQKVAAPYLTTRWIGGFLTNFDEIYKNIKNLKTLKEQKEKGELSKYTKKEQLLIDRKITKMEIDFGGAAQLENIPDAIFVADANKDDIALREASKIGVKVVAVLDSNANPLLVDYPIPGNDDAIKSIKIIAEAVAQAYEDGKAQAGKMAAKAERKANSEKKEEGAIEVPEEEIAVAEEEVEKEAVKESERVVE